MSPDQRLGLKRSVETLAQRFNGFALHNDIILPCKNGKKKLSHVLTLHRRGSSPFITTVHSSLL